MSEVVTPIGSNLPAQFKPDESRNTIAQADAVINWAKEMKDWPALERAIDVKIEQQKELVRWWKESVKHGKLKVTDTVISSEDAEKLTGFTKMQISRLRKKLDGEEKYREILYGAAYRKAFPLDSIADKMTGDEESYTPAKYVDSARLVMGGIDTDPASNPMAQETVCADEYFTVEDDGLSQDWHGKVWMNPPYTARVINRFIDKLVEHYRAGDITDAIVLTNNNTDTSWFHGGASVASAVCFTAGRINFIKPDESTSSPTNGQSFLYFGDDVAGFKAEFSKYGMVMVKA